METARQKRLVGREKAVILVNRCAAHMGAVIAFFQRKKLGAPGISANFVILSGKA